MNNDQRPAKVKVANLYKKTSQKGMEYYTGPMGNVQLVVMPNGYKQNDQDADFVVYIAEKQQAQKQYQSRPQQQAPAPKPQPRNFAPKKQNQDWEE